MPAFFQFWQQLSKLDLCQYPLIWLAWHRRFENITFYHQPALARPTGNGPK